MLPRRHISPAGHWRLAPSVTNNSQGIVCNKMIFVAGQVDLDERNDQQHMGDLRAQASAAMNFVSRVLGAAGADFADLVKLTVFYVSDGGVDEDDLLRYLAGALGPMAGPGPAITAIPLPGLAHPGMMIEIEGFAMRHPNGERLPRIAAWLPDCPSLPPPFSHALRCEEMIFTSAVSARDVRGVAHPCDIAAQSHIMLRHLRGLLACLGADLDDVVKTNVFNVDGGTKATWKESALARAAYSGLSERLKKAALVSLVLERQRSRCRLECEGGIEPTDMHRRSCPGGPPALLGVTDTLEEWRRTRWRYLLSSSCHSVRPDPARRFLIRALWNRSRN